MRRLLLALGFILSPCHAWAQRGEPPAQDRDDSPLAGFPGMFDTFGPREDSFVLTGTGALVGKGLFPNLQVDYGLTRNFSIGTSALTLASLSGIPAFAGKARYRLAITDSFHSALTLYGFYFDSSSDASESEDDEESSTTSASQFIGYMGTINVTSFLSPRLTVGGTLANLWVHAQIESSLGWGKILLSSFFVGGHAQWFPWSWFGPRVLLLLPVHLETSTDAGSVSFSAERSALPLIYHALADLRIGANWLVSVGFCEVSLLSWSGVTLEVTRRW